MAYLQSPTRKRNLKQKGELQWPKMPLFAIV